MNSVSRLPNEEKLEGIGLCPGIAIGTAFLVDDPRGRIIRIRLKEEDIEGEIARFRAAIEVAQSQLHAVYARLQQALGDEQAYILEAHVLLLQDQSIGRQVEQFIRDNRANAEWAVRAVSNRLLAVYAEITDEYMRARSTDLEDVANRIITILSGSQRRSVEEFSEDAILVADDLLPSIAAELNASRVQGFVTNVGGWTSHTAIIARSLNIPAVAGLRNITSRVRSGDTMVINGHSGTVILRPRPDTLKFYLEERAREREQYTHFIEERDFPSVTRDGTRISLRANIELTEEIDTVRKFNAAGIGLFRSEFLYAKAGAELPSEEEQFQVYRLLAETSSTNGAIIRTFDLGGDKLHLPGFVPERNPALGLRAIRLSGRVEDVFRTQLKAIMRAASIGNLKVVLPLKVRANPALPVTVKPASIIDFKQAATLTLANTQQSAKYQVFMRTIPDRDFVHTAASAGAVLKVPVENAPDVQIRAPSLGPVWATPDGYTAIGDFQPGNGGYFADGSYGIRLTLIDHN